MLLLFADDEDDVDDDGDGAVMRAEFEAPITDEGTLACCQAITCCIAGKPGKLDTRQRKVRAVRRPQ